MNSSSENYLNLNMVCDLLSISVATGKNWIKLGKLIPSDTKGKTFLFEKEYIENLKKDIKSGKNTANIGFKRAINSEIAKTVISTFLLLKYISIPSIIITTRIRPTIK